MYSVTHRGTLIAAVGNIRDIKKGLYFYGDGSEMLQWGTMLYDKGKVLQPHIHKRVNRQYKHPTQEFLYIIEGSVEITLYSRKKEIVMIQPLKAGDFICTYDGGHGYKVLEDNTKMIEVKHGPFISVENDKEKF